ncbi:MAG: translation initiation factor IF-2 [Clostridia bacterium]|nr:translation initiation factor IF-2 [Clostridia bacterium]
MAENNILTDIVNSIKTLDDLKIKISEEKTRLTTIIEKHNEKLAELKNKEEIQRAVAEAMAKEQEEAERKKAEEEAEAARKAEEEKAKAEEEAKAKEAKTAQEEAKTEEVQEEQPVVEEPVQEEIKTEEPVQEETKPEEPTEVKPEPEKGKDKDKKKQGQKAPEYEIISVEGVVATVRFANGDEKKIFIGPKNEKPEKAPKGEKNTITRTFGPNDGKRTQKQGSQGGDNSKPGQGSTVPVNYPPKIEEGKKGKKNKFSGEEKTIKNEKEKLRKGYVVDTKHRGNYDYEDEDENGYVRQRKVKHQSEAVEKKADNTPQSCVITTEIVPIKTLSSKTGIAAAEIIKKLFMLGMMKTINDNIDIETAQLIATEFNINIEYKPEITTESILSTQQENDDIEELDKLQPRPPIITVMGHVDHGKTSLLDYIRKANVASKEAGGITQAIGAYTVKVDNNIVTFIDTPGHEAFTAMRARGSQVTDIAILVVAADDGIMPQTIESINHAKNAGVRMIVALNKMDRPGANPDRVLQQLSANDVQPAEWGGQVPVVRVSAKTGLGIDELLETITLVADDMNLEANPDRRATGTVIESRLDKGKGPIATILVQKGTLKVGDYVVAGTVYGKIRSMTDDKNKAVKSAGPSIPVSVAGFMEVPAAGDPIIVVENERFAKELVEERRNKLNKQAESSGATSLADVFAKIKAGELKSLKLIVKADVQGSVEAVCSSLQTLGNDEVKVEIIHKAVGAITDNDINLAVTAKAIIIGFNLNITDAQINNAAKIGAEIKRYDVIYDAINDIQLAVKGMLAPKIKEIVNGQAEVRQLFNITGAGVIAGSHVINGLIARGSKARVIRNNETIVHSKIASLKHNKDDVKEIKEGWDCGIQLMNFQDIQIGDIIESYTEEEVRD